MAEDSDPLAATAPEASPPARPSQPAWIGRYRVDRVLGRGAMGTVYAAYDPGLDRHVALKVLHGERNDAARERLLREARAMARLHHGNVVTVHEVGTEGEIDYIVMELVDGETVEEWLRDPRVSRADRIAAFVAAGRGLAAAHAAGLVHRDFKPHNILRAKSGRIVVTDFGLARGDSRVSEPKIPTLTDSGNADLSSTLTQSGALLGTPAYMAPEQFQSSSVGPAADQFAFCVAVWEAIAGRRPFTGPTLYEQRLAIDRGPDPETQKRIPRRLRKILRRGLAVDPARRWPSMTALLAVMRRPVSAIAVAAALVLGIACVVAGWLMWRGANAPACDDGATAIAGYRDAPARAQLVARGPAGRDVIAPLDALADDWVRVRDEACAAPDAAVRARQLACLEVVRDELAVAAEVTAAIGMDLRDVDAASAVGDPLACRAGPARVAPARDERGLAVARFLAEELPQARWPAEPSSAEAPCTRALWVLARATQAAFADDRNSELKAAAEHAERCGDERQRAVIAVITAEFASANPFGLAAAIKRAELAVERAGGDRMLSARLRLLDAIALSLNGELDEAIATGLAAIDSLAALRAYTAVVIATTTVVELLRTREGPGDSATSERLLRTAIPHAGPRSQFLLTSRLAMALWNQGKLDEAHRVSDTFDPGPVPDGIAVRGRVIDGDGKPVAGARVVAAGDLAGDARAIAIAPDRQTRTTADGTFTLTGVARTAVVGAQHGELRSIAVRAAPTVELALAPTGSVTGRVIRKHDVGAIQIAATAGPPNGGRWSVLGILAADGTFRIDGVPRGTRNVVAGWGAGLRLSTSKQVAIGATPAGPVELVVAATGVELSVIIRPEAEGRLAGAQVWAIEGRAAPATVRVLAGIPGTRVQRWARIPDDRVRARIRELAPDDLFATVRGLPAGEVTACATALGDLEDAAYVARLNRHFDDLELRCQTTTLSDDTPPTALVVPVPPPRRFSD